MLPDWKVKELLDDADTGYVVPCDQCRGHRYIEQFLCTKCDGNGVIWMPPQKRKKTLASHLRDFVRKFRQ